MCADSSGFLNVVASLVDIASFFAQYLRSKSSGKTFCIFTYLLLLTKVIHSIIVPTFTS